MASLNSLMYKPRTTRVYKDKIKLLAGAPMKLGVVTSAVLRSPKKPHSAKRATVKFFYQAIKKKKIIVILMVKAVVTRATPHTIN